MTISTTSSTVTVAGNGATTSFDFPFVYDASANITVSFIDSSGNETSLVQGSQYTLTLNAPGAGQIWGVGGTVTYPLTGSPIATGTYLVISRVVPLVQLISIANQGAFYPQIIEKAMDLLEMQIQEVEYQASRAIVVNPADQTVSSPLPPIAVRASQYAVFDSQGNLTAGLPVGGSATVSAAMQPVVDAATTQVAMAVLGTIGNFANIASMRSNTLELPAVVFLKGYNTTGDGGEGVFWLNTSDTTSADNGGTIIVDDAGGRWYRVTGAQSYSVHWFGAVGDGTTNDYAAVAATIAAVAAAGGGRVLFGPKQYNMGSNTISITHSAVVLQGAGQFVTTLLFTGGNDCIQIVGTNYTTMIKGNMLLDFSITCTSKTGGRAIYIAYCFNAIFERLYINNPWTGIEDYCCNTVTFQDVSIAGLVGGTSARGIYFHAPADGSAFNIELNMTRVLVNALWSGADGIVWDGAAYTLNLDNVTCLDVRYGLLVNNTAVSNAYYPEYLEAMIFTVDGASQDAVIINGGGNFKFTGCNLQNTSGESGQGSADNQAVVIQADASGSFTHEVYFVNCLIGASKNSAVVTAAKNVMFNTCRFGAAITTPSNTVPAVHVAAGAADTIISDCMFSYFGDANDWNYGVVADSGSFRTQILGGDFNVGCLSGAFLNNSGDTNTFINNFLGPSASQPGPIVQLPKFSAAPANPAPGQGYFNTTTNKAQMWDGSIWNNLW